LGDDLQDRIVVLGASGFIGRRVVHALSMTDWAQPVAVSRHASAMKVSRVELCDADVFDGKTMEAVVASAAGIVNCIAGTPELIVSTTRGLIKAANSMSVPARIVQLSSLAAYGSTTGMIDELTPLRGDLGEYSAAKAQSDRMAADYENAVILRPGIVYGPGSSWWSDRIARLLVRGRLGNLGVGGEGNCNLVYVDDVASAALLALRLPGRRLGAFNLSLPMPLTWNEYFAQYAAALSALPVRSISRLRLAAETRILSLPLKAWERLLSSPQLACWNPFPPLRPWLPTMCSHDIRMEVSRAEKILGMHWTPVAAGLQTTADWFRSGGRTTG
jgi:2-alkyl-3-oxoalkanoate reductase